MTEERSALGSRNAMTTSDFALPGSRMFIKAIIQRVAKNKEITAVTVGGVEHTGFITGMDAEWIQITTTVGQQLVLLNLLTLESIEETGKSLSNVDISENQKEKIKVYSATVYVKAREILRADEPSKRRRARMELVDAEDEDEEVPAS